MVSENDLKTMREALEEARDRITELTAHLNQLTAAPIPLATVLFNRGTDSKLGCQVVGVSFENKVYEVYAPKGIKIEGGQTVRLSSKTLQIISVVEEEAETIGQISTFRRMIDDRVCEIEGEGGIRTALIGRTDPAPKPGDRVVVDETSSVIVKNMGKEDSTYRLSAETGVTLDDIGGNEEAKEAVIEAIELPHKHPEMYKHYGKRPPKGIQLSGPPGCGKTLLVKAIVTMLSALYGKKGVATGLFAIKGPEILDKYVGVSEGRIRQIFGRAREHFAEHRFPAVVFIDEAESILAKRGSGISSDVNNTIVPSFLAEMDGLEASNVMVILATNRPDILDPAVIREGRIDRKIRIGRPKEKDAADIFHVHLRGKPMDGDKRGIVKDAGKEIYADSRILAKVKLRNGVVHNFPMAGVASGAMIAGLVDMATSNALHRDIKSGKTSGISPEDMCLAVESSFRQNSESDHLDAIDDWIEERCINKSEVVSVQKVKGS